MLVEDRKQNETKMSKERSTLNENAEKHRKMENTKKTPQQTNQQKTGSRKKKNLNRKY
jgi:hypothetical protein